MTFSTVNERLNNKLVELGADNPMISSELPKITGF